MKSTNLHLGTNGFIQIERLDAEWSRGSVVTQSFPSCAADGSLQGGNLPRHLFPSHKGNVVQWIGRPNFELKPHDVNEPIQS